jgi:hypothetical protein
VAVAEAVAAVRGHGIHHVVGYITHRSIERSTQCQHQYPRARCAPQDVASGLNESAEGRVSAHLGPAARPGSVFAWSCLVLLPAGFWMAAAGFMIMNLRRLLSCPAPYKSPLWGGSRYFFFKRGWYAQVMCV